MQKGILVKDGGTLIEKRVYAGDISQEVMDAAAARLEAQYPGKTVTIFDSDEDSDFVNA